MTELRPHEASALFPILGKDDLETLAADIKSNGLLEPISLYDGKVLDGRNRLNACKLVGVTPRFEKLDVEASKGELARRLSAPSHSTAA